MLLNLFTLLLVIFHEQNVRSAKQQQKMMGTTVKTTICPLKCICKEDIREMICQNLTRVEIRQLFGSGGTFVTQFAGNLRNLSILNSEMEEMNVLPRMPNLLCLSLRGNQLENVKIEWEDSSADDDLGPAFPSLILLDLSFNKIPAISRNEFLQFPNVEEIRLENNRIFSIEWEAFRLFKLKRLILRDNYLLIISEHILRYSPSIEHLDLSRNQLSIAQSSSFFAAQRLKSLNLSHNRLQRFDYDSFSPLFQLESMDLSFNNFTEMPADLRQFVALRMLNFSGNPIIKLAEGNLVQPMLQTFDLSFCPNLRMIEQRAFGMTPNLQFLTMANNPSLQFISPLAFPNNSLLFELSISNNSLQIIGQPILELPSRIFLGQNPLECGCVQKMMEKFKEKIVDFKEAKCMDEKRIEYSLGNLANFNGKCSPNPILPFGNLLTAKIGDFFSIYCAPRNVEFMPGSTHWKLPNGSEIGAENVGERNWQTMATKIDEEKKDGRNNDTKRRVIPHGIFNPVVISAPKIESSYLGGIFPTFAKPHLHHNQRHSSSKGPSIDDPGQQEFPQQKPRVQNIGEQLRFEVLMAEDAGEYICRINGTETKLHLTIQKPNIQIRPIEIGSHFVSLAWNDTLMIRAFERVQISLQIHHALTGQIGRIIQLSLHNPWHNYNVVRLRPLTEGINGDGRTSNQQLVSRNYTFCLVYNLREPGIGNNNIAETAKILYKTCVDVMTEQQIGFWSSLSPTAIGIMMAFCFIIFSLFCFRAIYLRFYIWHEAKMRARMNQSMSGQSFLSQSSSMHQNGLAAGISQSSTFDTINGGQFLNNFQQKQNGGMKKGKRKRKSAKGNKLLLENEKQLSAEQTEDIALC